MFIELFRACEVKPTVISCLSTYFFLDAQTILMLDLFLNTYLLPPANGQSNEVDITSIDELVLRET